MRHSRDVSSAFEDNWTTQVRKGVIELCVLNALGGGRLYGYDIVRRLRELDGMFISEGPSTPCSTASSASLSCRLRSKNRRKGRRASTTR
jgi:hypothetical protein